MTIQMARRMLYIPVLHIDANLINARQKLVSVNQLEQWCGNDVILINMSSTARIEAMAGSSAARTRKAQQQIFSATKPPGHSTPHYSAIEQALFPQGACNDNQRNDVKVVCEAANYSAILVTADGASNSQPGGILGNRHKLLNIVQVMHPDEAVLFVRRKIAERDAFNVRLAKEFGGDLPAWTGAD